MFLFLREVCESCELSQGQEKFAKVVSCRERGQGKFAKVVSCREDKVSLRKL